MLTIYILVASAIVSTAVIAFCAHLKTMDKVIEQLNNEANMERKGAYISGFQDGARVEKMNKARKDVVFGVVRDSDLDDGGPVSVGDQVSDGQKISHGPDCD